MAPQSGRSGRREDTGAAGVQEEELQNLDAEMVELQKSLERAAQWLT